MSTDPRSEPDDCNCLAVRLAARQFCRRPGRSAGEIMPPWAPIVRLRALDHAVIVMGRNVEMHEVYSSVCSVRGEPYHAKISPRRWIELSTCCCGNPGHWQRIMK